MQAGLAGRYDTKMADPNPFTFDLLPFSVNVYCPMTENAAREIIYDYGGSFPSLHMSATQSPQRNHLFASAAEKITQGLRKDLFTCENDRLPQSQNEIRVQHIDQVRPCVACDWMPGARVGNDRVRKTS
jgi:hypothetical protein